MTKVIKGKTYRSHTAQLIVTLPGHFPKTSNKWHETRLYRTQQGAYVFGRGRRGALTMSHTHATRGDSRRRD
jgi:hypothetical protein